MPTPRLIAAGARERLDARLLARRLFDVTVADGLFDWMRQPGVRTAVLLDPGVIGFVVWDDAQIMGLGVHPDRRGAGHGQRLLDHALTPDRPVRLHVAVANAGARDLYARRGFAPTGETGTYPDGTPYLTMYRHAHSELS